MFRRSDASSPRTNLNEPEPLSPLEFHVLLVLAREDLYGYAIMKLVTEHSAGAVRVELGSLYRVLSRLMEAELLAEVAPPADAPASQRGLPRRYYRITEAGQAAARAEAKRLENVVKLARALLPGAGAS
jgi:DNA-binding PadR family transcriptional regulator